MKEEKAQGIAPEPKTVSQPKSKGAIQAILVVAAIALMIVGVLNGSARDVLYKAITICTECVGLG
ncbi:MAG: thioredoxin [Clostridia bacterium]|nr:thioredoxin [Clostridia bacterium]